MMAIFVFVALLVFCAAGSSYVSANTLYERISVRSAILAGPQSKVVYDLLSQYSG